MAYIMYGLLQLCERIEDMCHCQYCASFRNYVFNGKGIGLKIATLVSFLTGLAVAIFSVFILRIEFNGHDFDSFIETLPVIKIENGEIVEPVYNNKVWVLPGTLQNNKDFVLVVNTTVDSVETLPASATVYVTRKFIYTQSDGSAEVIELPKVDNMIITHQVMKKSLSAVLTLMCIAYGFVVLITGLVSFLITYLLVFLFAAFFNGRISNAGWGRATSLPWSILWLGFASVALMGTSYLPAYPLPWISLLGAGATLFVGYYMRKDDEESDETPLIDLDDEAEEDEDDDEAFSFKSIEERLEADITPYQEAQPKTRGRKKGAVAKKVPAKGKSKPVAHKAGKRGRPPKSK